MDKTTLTRFFLNESTALERKEVTNWLLNPEHDVPIKSWMRENWDLICNLDLQDLSDNPDEEKLWLNIQKKIRETSPETLPFIPSQPTIPFSIRLRKYAAVAAVFIALFSASLIFLFYKNNSGNGIAKSNIPTPKLKNDVAAPKDNNAVLTLSNGKKIYLDSTVAGSLASQGGVEISKNGNGEIVYTGTHPDSVSFNTLSVPKGSKPVRLLLADRSVVWLNAASSVTFPTAFVGEERRVQISGEAYFEVAKNPTVPFFVTTDKVTVKVLGTHFNVNTYQDEKDVKVTLIEGLVNVTSSAKNIELKPGQQARFANNNFRLLNDVDIDEVMAWKNDQFYFSGNDIKSIMRQIEKYYNVEVVYGDEIPYQFVAKISRQVNVSEFLKRLELTNLIHFKIDGNKIIVTK